MIKAYRKTATIKAEQFDGSNEMVERYDMGFQLAPNGKGGRLTDKLGKPAPKAIGYYPDLSSALKAFYTQRLIDDNEVLKIDEYLILLNKANRELSKKLDFLNVGDGDDD
ncbi:hypothetical protein [Lactiplantibacillus paraplantarum]|uniref:hypothetical protein n=1 Tax=Lactiplantibacillus paraplantarum TaxID=60520 RepID=UPI003DA681E7